MEKNRDEHSEYWFDHHPVYIIYTFVLIRYKVYMYNILLGTYL